MYKSPVYKQKFCSSNFIDIAAFVWSCLAVARSCEAAHVTTAFALQHCMVLTICFIIYRLSVFFNVPDVTSVFPLFCIFAQLLHAVVIIFSAVERSCRLCLLVARQMSTVFCTVTPYRACRHSPRFRLLHECCQPWESQLTATYNACSHIPLCWS